MDRIFLDANVLYSAAYAENAGLERLWKLAGVELLSSSYAVEEARRNLAIDRPAAVARLDRLASTLTVVNPPQTLQLPAGIQLDAKDAPIMLAAIHAKADHLLTGDMRHFSHLYGKRVEGVTVLRPAQYFARRARS